MTLVASFRTFVNIIAKDSITRETNLTLTGVAAVCIGTGCIGVTVVVVQVALVDIGTTDSIANIS